jgi:hypothetical protein
MLSHSMKHDCHGTKWLQRCNADLVELLDQVLISPRLESKLLIGFTSVVLSNVLSIVLFLAFFDLDHSTLILVVWGQLDVQTQPQIFLELKDFVIVNPIRSIMVIETKEGEERGRQNREISASSGKSVLCFRAPLINCSLSNTP